jgi:hypothetical protein
MRCHFLLSLSRVYIANIMPNLKNLHNFKGDEIMQTAFPEEKKYNIFGNKRRKVPKM